MDAADGVAKEEVEYSRIEPNNGYTGGHRPSPYLRRFRLPHIGASSTITSSSTCCSYDDLLSPIDDYSKMIVVIEANKRHQLYPTNAVTTRPNTIVKSDHTFRPTKRPTTSNRYD